MLQLSSYWREGETIHADLLPGTDVVTHLKTARHSNGKRALTTELGHLLPAKLVASLAAEHDLTGTLADLNNARMDAIAALLGDWQVKPTGTEGYRTAEVTLGGISTEGFDSKTLMSKTIPGLYTIGEAIDVTGWLGGYNFQWAWASGVAAGQAIAQSRHKS